MQTRRIASSPRAGALAVLLVLAGLARPETQVQTPDELTPGGLTPGDLAPRNPTPDRTMVGPDPRSESPAVQCYRAAAGETAGTDDAAYVCDLAVQMARDGASRQALAAALANRALVLAAGGRLEPALTDLDDALTLTPDDPALHGNRGNLLLRLDRPAEALEAHDRAVALAPQDPAAYYNRAFSYRALGEPVRAEQDVAAASALLARRRLPVRDAETPEPADFRIR